MRERPIIFSAPMVRAILEGRKSQTRRIIKPQPQTLPGDAAYADLYNKGPHWAFWYPDNKMSEPRTWLCPYGEPGDRLWVRETWANFGGDADLYQHHKPGVAYRATWDSDKYGWPDFAHHVSYVPGDKWRPSIFMPRWASRITLEITEVWVQRVQEINLIDICAEGCPRDPLIIHRNWYSELWDSINAKPKYVKGAGFGGATEKFASDTKWADNPWVWVITFRRIAP